MDKSRESPTQELSAQESSAQESSGLDYRQNSDQRVIETIREMIAAGQLDAFEKLTESSISRQLGLSRTPVRAALKVLAAEGLLSKLAGRGYQVRRFTEQDHAAALDVRAILEALAAEQLARQGLDAQNKQRLEKSLAMTDTVVRRGLVDDESVEAFSVANLIFHRTIMSAAGNQFIPDCIGRLAVLPDAGLGAVHSLNGKYPTLERLAVSHQQHIIIAQAIERGEEGRAFAMMREHIGGSAQYHQLFGDTRASFFPE